MGLGMPVDDGRCCAAADGSASGGSIRSGEADGRAVVVQFVEAKLELLADGQHDLGQQRGAVGVEEPILGASEPVVAELLHRLGVDAEHAAGKAMDGLLLAVNRLALDDERA